VTIASTLEFPLVGPGGEPVDLWRTLNSHGVASLPPMRLDEDARTLTVTLALPNHPPHTVTIGAGRRGFGAVTVAGPPPSEAEAGAVLAGVKHILRFDQDLSPFYVLAANDPDLCWVTRGAGRMTRCSTVFEDVVKTICTTNCAWSATERMVGALVEHLGERASDAPATGLWGRTFPTPAAMASAGEDFYKNVARCGYRGRYLQQLARAVADGELDLEALGRATPEELPDDDLAKRLLALPGVGPYAAAHIMMMLGRSSRPIFDSWTRPKYARLAGRDSVPDAEIVERFRPYGRYAGLAFWLFVTRDWIDD
jgi:3-methyladenine DNA glycosylase/8-oxoguanine DNA glycosylase